MLKKVGNKYVLKTSDGSRNLSKPTSRAKAIKQEVAIKYAEARRGKK